MVLVELHPSKMAAGGGGTAAGLLRRMAAWGYTDVSHSGRVCDERWLNITKSIRCAHAARADVVRASHYYKSSSIAA